MESMGLLTVTGLREPGWSEHNQRGSLSRRYRPCRATDRRSRTSSVSATRHNPPGEVRDGAWHLERKRRKMGARRRCAVARHVSRSVSILEFERDVELGAVGLDLALGIELQIELDDFGDSQVPQRFTCSGDGGSGRLFPGFLAGTDQLDHLVDALWHDVLPYGFRQDAGCY